MRLAGVVILVGSLLWCGFGFVYDMTAGAADALMVSAIVAAATGPFAGALLALIGHGAATERRWRSGIRRGVVTIHDPRPGEVSASDATQELTCQLEIRTAGAGTTRASYRASVGPLDAARLVDGASFACQTSPALPQWVRVWLIAAPHAGELAGRYLDFQPAPRG